MTVLYFAIEPGHDVTAPTNVETLTTNPPHVLEDQPIPLTGPIKRRTLNHAVQANGAIVHAWVFDVLTRAEFNALIVHVFGDFLTESAEVTIIGIDETGNYGGFNTTVNKPIAGQDYR